MNDDDPNVRCFVAGDLYRIRCQAQGANRHGYTPKKQYYSLDRNGVHGLRIRVGKVTLPYFIRNALSHYLTHMQSLDKGTKWHEYAFMMFMDACEPGDIVVVKASAGKFDTWGLRFKIPGGPSPFLGEHVPQGHENSIDGVDVRELEFRESLAALFG